jgi:hypothetical protein
MGVATVVEPDEEPGDAEADADVSADGLEPGDVDAEADPLESTKLVVLSLPQPLATSMAQPTSRAANTRFNPLSSAVQSSASTQANG